jgi:hypothetical protein
MYRGVPPKIQNSVWWIISVALSVLSCAIIFVLFASYLVEVKQSIKENEALINIIQNREDRILSEVELIRQHAVLQVTPPISAGLPVTLSVDGPAPGSEKANAPMEPPAAIPATAVKIPVTPGAAATPESASLSPATSSHGATRNA